MTLSITRLVIKPLNKKIPRDWRIKGLFCYFGWHDWRWAADSRGPFFWCFRKGCKAEKE